MKLAAINEISKLNDEKSVKEILEYLEKLNDKAIPSVSQHALDIINERSSVLKKLAQ